MICETCKQTIPEAPQSFDETCATCKYHLASVDENERLCSICIASATSYRAYPKWTSKV